VTALVRPGTAADRDFVADLAHRTAADSVAAFRRTPDARIHESLDRLLDVLEEQSHVTLVAEIDGRPVGFLLMLDALPDEVTSMPQGFVAYMAVEPAARRRGAGRALLEAAEGEARRRSLPYMALMVTQENAAARALYESCGYFTERRLLCKAL